MSGDLISRSALLEMLRYNSALHTDESGETRQLVAVDIHKLIAYVEKMPTAFDVAKVVEQLEEEKADALCCTGDYEDFDPYYQGMANAYQQSIEMIREHREEPKQ